MNVRNGTRRVSGANPTSRLVESAAAMNAFRGELAAVLSSEGMEDSAWFRDRVKEVRRIQSLLAKLEKETSSGLKRMGVPLRLSSRFAGTVLGPGVPDGTGPLRGTGRCPFDEEDELEPEDIDVEEDVGLVASELVRLAEELVASDYSELDPRKVTTLAESIATGVLGWPKVAEVLANGYEFKMKWTPRGEMVEGLDKVEGLTKLDITKIGSSTWASSSVVVVKGRGGRKRELDKELEKLER